MDVVAARLAFADGDASLSYSSTAGSDARSDDANSPAFERAEQAGRRPPSKRQARALAGPFSGCSSAGAACRSTIASGFPTM
jgi:hypothetical protein